MWNIGILPSDESLGYFPPTLRVENLANASRINHNLREALHTHRDTTSFISFKKHGEIRGFHRLNFRTASLQKPWHTTMVFLRVVKNTDYPADAWNLRFVSRS
jgi:hypothetical protein